MITRMVICTSLVVAVLAVPNMGMDIVKEGKAQAVIVVQKDSQNANQTRRGKSRAARASGFKCDDQTAADVLADWLEKMADVRLEIADQPSADKSTIYVGAAAEKAGLNLNGIDSSTHEGLRILSDGKSRILIAGQNETSTVKAVCRFLEELGCRYLMDDKLGEVYPRSRTVTIGKLDVTEKPGLTMRKIWGSQWAGQTLWKVWNGAGGLEMATGHAWAQYVDENLFETHPEYFALRDGQRKKDGWYCTSNPELRKVFTEGVLSKGGFNPSVSPPDGIGYCQCEKCRAQDDPRSIEPSSGGVSMTNRYVDFLDEVAREVGKVHPDWLLSFYCYADYTQPPTLGRKLSPNLVAWIAPIRYSRFHRIGSPNSASTTQLAEVIDGWATAASRIAYRTYNYNLAECLVPFSKLSVWKHDIPYLKEKGCIGINLESLANWEIYGPHLYQSIRLSYDPGADSDAMMDDYFMKFYGPKAGPLMKQYWMSIDEAFADMKCESGSFYALPVVYTPQFLQKLDGLIQRAQNVTKNDKTCAARVEMTAQGFKNAAQYIEMCNAMSKGDFASAKKIYDELYSRNELEEKKGYGNSYTLSYLKRFVGAHVLAGAEATAPPNKVLQVLPDQMKMAYDLADDGVAQDYHKSDYDDSGWKQVATYSKTLSAQGLPDTKSIMWYRASIVCQTSRTGRTSLFFTEVDGQAVSVYINGKEAASLDKEARRKPFEVDVTSLLKPGPNVVAIKVDHRKITELSLGGIVRPILLIEKPPTPTSPTSRTGGLPNNSIAAVESTKHTVPKEHPRLLGSREYLQSLAASRAEAYRRVVNVTRESAGGDDHAKMISMALVCAIEGDRKIGEAAVQLAMKYIDGPIRAGHVTFAHDLARCAIVYDLCYDCWTQEQREQFHEYMNKTVDANVRSETHVFHNGWYGYKNWGIGLACYATYYENDRAPEILHALEEDWRTRAAPALELAGDGGGWAEGYYVNYWLYEWLFFCEAAQRCEGVDYYADAPKFFENRAIASMFETYPGISTYNSRRSIPMGDGGGRVFGGDRDKILSARRILVNHFRDDPNHEVVQAFNEQTPRSSVGAYAYKDFLWRDTTVEKSDLARFKLSHFSPGPGYVYARSSWDDDATYFFFKCGDRFTAHQHLDVGHFLVYKYEELAGDGGHYDSFGSDHDVNYHLRTIAHSTMLLYDPSEKWPNIRAGNVTGNDGGHAHNWPHHNGAVTDPDQWHKDHELYDIADMLAYEDKGTYMYVAGDCTRAYSADKMGCFTRQIVFLWPNTFVIFDRVQSKNPDFKKTWLLQAMKVPTRTDKHLVITNGKGRLFVQMLLPQDPDIKLISGSELYRYGGRDYPPSHDTGPAPECRIEVSPSKLGSWDYFLHVLTAADSGTDSVETAAATAVDEKVEVSIGKAKITFGTEQVGCRVDMPKGDL